MNITVTTPPRFEPVSLEEVYLELRLTPDDDAHPDDAMLMAKLEAARQFVETATRRSLVQQKLRLTEAGFCGLWLRRPPLIRVDAVRYFDSANAMQSVDPEDWYVTDDAVPELRFLSCQPITYCRADAVWVDYTTGYAPSGSPSSIREDFVGNIPQALKQAVLLGVALLYDNLSPADREATERAREALIQGYRMQRV
jgi:uncharacterized phiE125 gp8 family phage protein